MGPLHLARFSSFCPDSSSPPLLSGLSACLAFGAPPPAFSSCLPCALHVTQSQLRVSHSRPQPPVLSVLSLSSCLSCSCVLLLSFSRALTRCARPCVSICTLLVFFCVSLCDCGRLPLGLQPDIPDNQPL